MSASDRHTDEERRGWHFGREVPVAMILTIIIQTVSFVWWLSGLSERVATQGKALEVMTLKVEVIAANSLPAVTAARMNLVEAELKEVRTNLEALKGELMRRSR